MAQDAAQLTLVEELENALRAAHGGVRGAATGGEGVGAHRGGHVEARHGLAGSGGELTHDGVHLGLLGLGDLDGAHGAHGDLVGVP